MKKNKQLSMENGELKMGWEIKKLGECFKLKSGEMLTAKMMSNKGIFPVYGGNGISGLHNKFNLSGSNVIVGRVGALCGNARYINENIWLTDNGFQIVNFKFEFDHPFLTYLLNFKNLRSLARQAAQPVISNSSLNELILEFPKSLAEQQAIVAYLDETFEKLNQAKANLQKNLQNAKALFESELNRIFSEKGESWEEKTLKQVSIEFGRGKSKHRPRNFEGLYGGQYPFIQTGDIRNSGHNIIEYSQTYNEVGLSQSKLWPKGTICITIAANIAETGILTFDACFPDSIIGIIVNNKITQIDYVEYLLQTFKSNLQLLGKGAAQDNINMGTFENLLFPFPPLKTQQTIVQKLDTLSAETKKLESIYKQKLVNIEELKKRILADAFNGRRESHT